MRLRTQHTSLAEQSGFVMTTVIFLMAIMSVVAYAALLQANNSLNLSYKQSYIQMARVASKAAIDYAQEQFDKASCGAYSGTAEQDLVSNSRYRITLKAEVTNTSADGLTKTIKGTGSVYLPKLSADAKYVFDVRSEIIRTYALCKTPGDYGPIEWLDASDTSKLLKLPTGTSATAQGGLLGALSLILPFDSLEEKVSDGSQGLLSFTSDDLEAHTCDGLEYVLACSGTMAQKDLYNGFVFSTTIPKGYTINSATLQLTSAGGSGSTVTHRTYGLYNKTSGPHLALFTSGGIGQVKDEITNGSLHTTAFNDTTTNNLSVGVKQNFDVTSIVQEMVNRSDWSNGTLGLGILRQAGSGARKFCKGNIVGLLLSCIGNGPKLTVTYSAAAPLASANGDSVFEWDPVTGWGVPAKFAYGNQPTRVDNQINGKTIVRFNNGTLLSTLTSTLSGKREMTVLAVVKPNFTTSASDGRIVTGMTSTAANDTGASTGIIPLLRNGATSGFSSNYSGSGTTNRTDYVCGGACVSTPYIFASSFTIDTATNKITALLKGNGQQAATKTGINPAGSPYTFSIDQLYFGGRRNGTGGSAVGADYFNGDFAEIVVYDKALECRQIEAIEDYLRNKWAISASAYATTCPEDTIPTL